MVLIPFIDESKLLDAMESCNSMLTDEEAQRNCHGPMHIYTYTEQNLGDYPVSVRCYHLYVCVCVCVYT